MQIIRISCGPVQQNQKRQIKKKTKTKQKHPEHNIILGNNFEFNAT